MIKVNTLHKGAKDNRNEDREVNKNRSQRANKCHAQRSLVLFELGDNIREENKASIKREKVAKYIKRYWKKIKRIKDYEIQVKKKNHIRVINVNKC